MAPAIIKTVTVIQKILPTVRSNQDTISATKLDDDVWTNTKPLTRCEISTDQHPIRAMTDNLANHFVFVTFARDNITDGGSLGIDIAGRKRWRLWPITSAT